MAKYRFKVTSKQNNAVIGTGSFKCVCEITKEEQLEFLHQYSNGIYLHKDSFLIIEIWAEMP